LSLLGKTPADLTAAFAMNGSTFGAEPVGDVFAFGQQWRSGFVMTRQESTGRFVVMGNTSWWSREMAFNYSLEELEDDTATAYVDEAETEDASEYDSDGDGISFDDIDFEALGIDPTKPTAAKPGSEEKVLMLAARYAAGVPLWHTRDCYDHGPGESMFRMLRPSLQTN
jgi:hypothetical protein